MHLEHPGSGRAGASGPHVPQDPGYAATRLSRTGSACTRISKVGEPLLSWTRSQSTGYRKKQHCGTVPQCSLLNVPQQACGRLATRIRTQDKGEPSP